MKKLVILGAGSGGTMMANKLSFDALEYSENGRKVRCKTSQLRA